MESSQIIIVGGGPAGSTCAGKLKQAGLDVLLLDSQHFPREKPCAGWITPGVLETLGIDQAQYRQGHLLQNITSFRSGLIGSAGRVTSYGTSVSYGILRSEFDHFLLQRSGVRQIVGEPVTTLVRDNGYWIVNGHLRAAMLVGAGGHFCPVARWLGARIGHEEVIAAQVAEYSISPEESHRCPMQPEMPELYFCRDMRGYGWLFRKGDHIINIGMGRRDCHQLGRHTKEFCSFLEERGDLPTGFSARFQGHAYLLYDRISRRTCVGDGVLLIGDAAGLAHPISGEGILPAIESARLAAETIIAAAGAYTRDRLEPYAAQLARHFDRRSLNMPTVPGLSPVLRFIGARLLSNRLFSRHVVLDRWFLHT